MSLTNHKHLHLSIAFFVLLFFAFAETKACERCIEAGRVFAELQYDHSTPTISVISSPGETLTNATEKLSFLELREAVVRYREISLDDRTKGQGWINKHDHIILNLFDDVEIEAHVQRVGVNVNRTFSITAVLPDQEGYAILVTTGSRSHGSVYLPATNMYYKIISDPETYQHYVIEMDARDRDIIETSPPLIPEINEQDIKEQQRINEQMMDKSLGQEDVAHIGVMVVYTPMADYWVNNNTGSNMNNVIAMAMANAQLVLDNSETLMEMELVHSDVVFNYVESGSSTVDLVRLTASPHYNPWGNTFNGYDVPGHMEEIHQWRDQYRASLTAIFTYAYDTGGIAWLLADRNGNPNRAFSMTRIQQATGYTHIHEMGHNMGLHHHAEQNFQPGPTLWNNWPENRWSAGWRWANNNNNWFVTVMSYSGAQYYNDGDNAAQVPYFSSPRVNHQGIPTGHPEKADNARTLLEMKHVIANYKPMGNPGVATTEVTDISFTTAVSGGFIDDISDDEIIDRGVIWSRTDNLTLTHNEGITSDGKGQGHFVSELTDLFPGTDYFVRAYAVTSNAVILGTFQVFSTSPAYEPSVSTIQVTNVTLSTAATGGTVTHDGNVPVLSRGVVWSTEPYPDIARHVGKTVDGDGEGGYTSLITGLSAETTYYYRSYATNIVGTSYGGHFQFTTPGPRVYPNPASNELYVEFNNESENPVAVVLANYMGQIIKREEIKEQGEFSVFFNTAALRGGLYLVYFESDMKLPVWQVVIARQ